MGALGEVCFICSGPTTVVETDNIALCPRHWNRWLTIFIGPFAPLPPCGAHLITDAEAPA